MERLTGTHSVSGVTDLRGESRVSESHRQEEWQAPEEPEEEYAEEERYQDSHDSDDSQDGQDETTEEEEDEEPGLAIDMYESDNELVIQSMIAGITPENLHISITRNAVTIRGRRNEPQGIPDEHYITRELYWGSFSRLIELPYEINTEGAEAIEKYGLLIIRLPRLDTERTAELKVKSI